MDTVDKATNTNNEHVGAEEADEGGDFEITRVQDDEAHHCATDANRDTDEAIGVVFGGDDAMDDVDHTRNGGINSKYDGAVSEVVVREQEKTERSDDVNERIDDGVDPATFFGGVVECA